MKMLKQISRLILVFTVLGLLQNCNAPADEVLEPTVVATVITKDSSANSTTTDSSSATGRKSPQGYNSYIELFITFSEAATYNQKLMLQNYFVNSYGEEVIIGNTSENTSSSRGGSSSVLIWKLNTDEPLPPISNCEGCNVDDIELPEDLLTLITAYTL